MRRLLATLALAGVGFSAAAVSAGADEIFNDYPTAARADYVFACMAANGQTQEFLIKCSCSIDHIAFVMPYEQYVQAETILRMRQIAGERVGVFRDTPWMQEVVDNLRRAQAQAEFKCF